MFDGSVVMNAHSVSKKGNINPSVVFNIYDDLKSVKWNIDVTEEQEDEADALLQTELNQGDRFIASGHRNDTAVNMCIALHVLGISDIEGWFDKFFIKFDNRFDKDEVKYFMDHVYRVINYIDTWGPEGKQGEALGYML